MMKVMLIALLSFSLAVHAQKQTGLTDGAKTITLQEVDGLDNNDCITFTNNGEIVTAHCNRDHTDRQLSQITYKEQANVLYVRRRFSATERADLVDNDACVGFNGTAFLAMDCKTANLARFEDEQIITKDGKCISGQNGHGVTTVGHSDHNECASYTVTEVEPTDFYG